MAQRRMFTMQIIDSDAFLDMPQTAQLLYFHLAMRADDDGFVGNPKKIMRMTGSNDDDLKVLIAKRFILIFENGIVVIKHWRMHNYIQKDRYKETQYLEEKSGLKIKENGSYTECIQDVSKMDTQVRLGKVRLELEEVNLSAKSAEGGFLNSQNFKYPEEFEKVWAAYPKKAGKAYAFKIWKKIKHPSVSAIIAAIEKQKPSLQWTKDGGQFIPDFSKWLNQGRWDDEVKLPEPIRSYGDKK